MLHFGRCCLTPSKTLPVLYILSPNIHVDTEEIATILNQNIENKNSKLILTYDTRCYYIEGEFFSSSIIVIYTEAMVFQK